MTKTVLNHRSVFLALLILLTTGIYWAILSASFVWDDRHFILPDPGIGRPPLRGGLPAVLNDFREPTLSYRPLHFASLLVDFKLWGLNSRAYHATGLFIYLLTVLLVYGIASRFWVNEYPARWTALLFAVHPIHVEPVGWISARSDLLCGLFSLLSFYLYLIFRQASGGLRGTAYAASLLGFALALGSKEMAISLPFVLLAAYLWFPFHGRDRRKTRGAFLETAPYFVLLILYLVWRLNALDAGIGSGPPEGTTAARLWAGLSPEMIGTIARVTLEDLRILLLPFSLRAVYDLAPVSNLLGPQSLLSISGCVGSAVAAGILYRYSTRFFWAAAYLILTTAPAYLVILTRNNVLLAERYLFIASVGFCLLTVGVGNWFYDRRPVRWIPGLRSAYIGAGLGLVAILAFLAVQRTTVWQDEKTLWFDTAQKSPRSSLARTNLGYAYLEEDRPGLAEAELQAALQIDPGNAAAHGILAGLYYYRGRVNEAIEEYKTAVRIDPGRSKARYALGIIYQEQGETESAMNELQAALALNPDFAAARMELGVVYHSMGRYEAAIGEYQKLRNHAADFPMLYYNLGLSYWKAGEREMAARSFARFAETAPPRYESYRRSALSHLRDLRQP